ncbi:MAG: hypothetical protein ACOX66_07580 [Oscillospiraceae bacterium]|jgi:hypothetical protein
MKKEVESLKEMARIILAELDYVDMQNAVMCEHAASKEIEYIELQDTLEATSRERRYNLREVSNRRNGTDTRVPLMSQPRTTRRAFLSQRLERRAARENEETAGALPLFPETEASDPETERAAFVTDIRRDELTDAGLPARLSEVYHRDARRYDGPFERY